MKTKYTSFISPKCHPFSAICLAAATLLFGVLAGSAQTSDYLYSDSEQTVTLNPGLYDITAYGAQGGNSTYGGGYYGGLGAEMEGEFDFTTAATLTLLVGGGGSGGTPWSGAGGGGSFVVNGSAPLVVAGGGGGSGFYINGGNGLIGNSDGAGSGYGGSGGAGGGGYSGGGGSGIGGGGGGGSYIDSSAIADLTEISGVASPDDSPNGEIIITAVPEPTTLALAGLSGVSLLLFCRQQKPVQKIIGKISSCPGT